MMRHSGWIVSILAFAMLWVPGTPARGDEPKLAISGYDAVAYFTDGKPVLGQADHEYVWHKSRWRFASAQHRDLFVHDPDRYAPQYDGYCAMGVASAEPHKDLIDPQAWTIVDGKLYLTHNAEALGKFKDQLGQNIKQANENWPAVRQQAVIYDGFPNVKTP